MSLVVTVAKKWKQGHSARLSFLQSASLIEALHREMAGFSSVLVWFSTIARRTMTSPLIYHVQRCLFLFLGQRHDYLFLSSDITLLSSTASGERAKFVAHLALVIKLVRLWPTCLKFPLQLAVRPSLLLVLHKVVL